MARALIPTLRTCCAAFVWVVAGCGGGAPLLHGAHALSPKQTSFGAGFSGTFLTGPARQAVQAAREPLSPSTSTDVIGARESAVNAAMAPSVAPWVGARVGLPADNEAGIAFTGRALRLDARHVFEDGPIAFSIGAAGNVVWRNTDPVSQGSSTFFNVRSGYGFDVPLLVGWQSTAGVVSLWGGARGGMETIGAVVSDAGPGGGHRPFEVVITDVDLWRRYVGGVAGLSMGFRHVHVVLELDVLYQAVSGRLYDADVRVDGVTLSPAGGLILTF